MTPKPAPEAWHLDKRIPLALIFTLVVQAVVVIWYGSNLVRDVEAGAEMNVQQNARISLVEGATNAQAVGAATTAAQLTAVRESLNEMKAAQSEMTRLLRDIVAQGANP